MPCPHPTIVDLLVRTGAAFPAEADGTCSECGEQVSLLTSGEVVERDGGGRARVVTDRHGPSPRFDVSCLMPATITAAGAEVPHPNAEMVR